MKLRKPIRWTTMLVLAIAGTMLFAAVAQAASIFTDDFETGDLSLWDSVLVEAGNTVEVVGAAAHEGAFGLHVQTGGVIDDARIGKEITPTYQLYTKVWMNMLEDVGTGNHQHFLVLASHRDDSNSKIGTLAVRRTSDDPENNFYTLAYSGAGPQPWEDTDTNFQLNQWSCVELFVSVSSTAGELKVWIDGTVVADQVAVNTGDLPISWIRLGADGPEVTGNYYFDEFAADDANRVACEDVPPPPPPSTGEDARTIGYWKNHSKVVAPILAAGSIDLGDTLVTTVNESRTVLRAAKAKDMKDMLRAQLLGTLLNLRNGADPNALGYDITPVAAAAVDFLATHSGEVLGGDADRDEAEALKNALDAYNNSGED